MSICNTAVCLKKTPDGADYKIYRVDLLQQAGKHTGHSAVQEGAAEDLPGSRFLPLLLPAGFQ